MPTPESQLAPGSWVEVRSLDEIAATLDGRGTLEALPFMPEMRPACGNRFRVAMRAERACVRGLPAEAFPIRALDRCVVLEGQRCDGSSHAGCQLGCTILWKEAWLRPLASPADARRPDPTARPTERPLLPVLPEPGPPRYVCQGTELVHATRPGPPRWRPGQYLHLVRAGTVRASDLAAVVLRGVRGRLRRAGLRALRRPPPLQREAAPLDLAAGDCVQVRTRAEIQRTLDASGSHRGLHFSADMYTYCGQRLRVARRVETILQEETGRPRRVRDTVTLDGAFCRRHLGCAREMPLLWREAWLRRVPATAPRRAAIARRSGPSTWRARAWGWWSSGR